jgi:hypothetical protein
MLHAIAFCEHVTYLRVVFDWDEVSDKNSSFDRMIDVSKQVRCAGKIELAITHSARSLNPKFRRVYAGQNFAKLRKLLNAYVWPIIRSQGKS